MDTRSFHTSRCSSLSCSDTNVPYKLSAYPKKFYAALTHPLGNLASRICQQWPKFMLKFEIKFRLRLIDPHNSIYSHNILTQTLVAEVIRFHLYPRSQNRFRQLNPTQRQLLDTRFVYQDLIIVNVQNIQDKKSSSHTHQTSHRTPQRTVSRLHIGVTFFIMDFTDVCAR